MAGVTETVPVRVRHGCESDDETVLSVPVGTALRDALLDAGISPHGRYARRVNCRGNGLCATCGVRILESDGDTTPAHWHDRLADRFGYPRLSCQVVVDAPLTVAVLPDKRVWGERD